jgi:hypothetical protein
MEHSSDNDFTEVNRSNLRIRPEDSLEVVVANHLKGSAVSALQAIDMPVTTVVRSSFTDHRGAVMTLAESRNKFTIKIPEELRAVNALTRQDTAKNLSNTTNQKGPTQKGSGRRQLESNDRLLKGLIGVGAQNRRMMWLLVYVAVVTTCPLIGSALFFRARGRIAALTKRLLK